MLIYDYLYYINISMSDLLNIAASKLASCLSSWFNFPTYFFGLQHDRNYLCWNNKLVIIWKNSANFKHAEFSRNI